MTSIFNYRQSDDEEVYYAHIQNIYIIITNTRMRSTIEAIHALGGRQKQLFVKSIPVCDETNKLLYAAACEMAEQVRMMGYEVEIREHIDKLFL